MPHKRLMGGPTMPVKLSQQQIDFGNDKMVSLRTNWGLNNKQIAKILLDINTIRDFYNWINAQDYLYFVLDGNNKQKGPNDV